MAEAQPPKSAGASRLARFLTPRGSGAWMWVEAAMVPALAVWAAFLAKPLDPLFTEAGFPWPWLGPVLVALRYGVLPGLAGAAVLFGGWLLLYRVILGGGADLPTLWFLGGLLLVMVCGQYSGTWRTRLRRLEESNEYLDERLGRVTRRHYLLRLSHERLEQDLLSRPATLRDMLGSLRLLIVGSTRHEPLPAARNLLLDLAQFCRLDEAAIHESLPDGSFAERARVGNPPPLKPDDPVFAHARRVGLLTHVQSAALAGERPGDYLVVAPLATSGGAVLGWLTVSRMPFFALNDDTLQTLGVLVGYYADHVVVSEEARQVLAEFFDCPEEFAEELARLTHLQAVKGITSSLGVFVFGEHPRGADMAAQILRVKRELDLNWSLPRRGLLLNLMPLAGSAAVEGYQLRMDALLRERFGQGLAESGVFLHTLPLTGGDPVALLQRALAFGAAKPPAA